MLLSVGLLVPLAVLTVSPLGWAQTGPRTAEPASPSADQADDRLESEAIRQWQAKHATSAEPPLPERYLVIARAYRVNEEPLKAANAYRRALTSVDPRMPTVDQERQKKVLADWTEMVNGLRKSWEQAVKKLVEKDQKLQELAAKYSPVVLNSRRYTDGNYMGSAYSFSHETADPEKHKNRVELEFDNGRGDNTFQVNMLVDQQNLVADLGEVDFKDFDLPKNVDLTDKDKWHGEAKAVTGHVYLEKVRDSKGDDFFALFQVIATDKDSRYVAFIWRRMPGGKVGN
jgi:hypothetical protein